VLSGRTHSKKLEVVAVVVATQPIRAKRVATQHFSSCVIQPATNANVKHNMLTTCCCGLCRSGYGTLARTVVCAAAGVAAISALAQ
jgi:hypothetical protein